MRILLLRRMAVIRLLITLLALSCSDDEGPPRDFEADEEIDPPRF